ncbi:MFS transporter [Bradyrhizobium sacchari]|uniref:Bcr/CflA family efflux transporter n=1 Tax=Bradyrhizobium sacchari TaxID=1399419 RepID=A0A560JLD3_9BRAD|nr:multidrug effflux MFS transporter [Bradyrhizobium sacchari]OPY98552.1 MFS transporter [Bradyrhizobium sacchari]TWB52416.1 DHA1 family bicyclomycin/chloramphenicol resistance-like MFS transporter [Bradyrhizobium sacchari]TWB70224.1 DHA1 family bicyclomycin/chloramphenicol resistance-like MFS transporter [Bradyrhizobium sacchari]
MRIEPDSFAFTVLLGALAAVPYSGIDINLPALAATGATLGTSASDVGLTMSAFMLSLATAPLVYGPVSDRLGRKPVLAFGLALFVAASISCALATSLPLLLVCRFFQGIGAAATATTFAIIRDLFDGDAARGKIANVMVAVNVATVIAPTAGAALLAAADWRSIYATQAAIGLMLLLVVMFRFAETAPETTRLAPSARLVRSAVTDSYRRVLTHPVSLPFILVGAAGGATVFAYVTGASLFFVGAVGLSPEQYGLIFSACSASVMAGAFLDGQLGRRGISSSHMLATGLTLSSAASVALLAMTSTGWMPTALVVVLLMAVALGFGLSVPNVMSATMQHLPDIAGAVSAAAGSIQLIAGAISSGLVATRFDGRTALSMTAVMAASSLLALGLYFLVARPADRRLQSRTIDAGAAIRSPTRS